MKVLFYLAAGLCVLSSAFTFLLCGIDKSAARHERRRIPEKRFFLLALLGGSFGLTAGMLCFRHKTKHASFVIAAILGMLIWTALLYLLAAKGLF